MMELVEANWILLVAALLIGLLVAWWIFAASRKTRVSGDRRDVLDEGADPATRNQALIDSAAAARADTPVPIPQAIPVAAAAGDDLTRIKGIGPKLRDVLVSLGVTRFDQIAGWSDEDIDRIDARLGRFEGRIRRDNWVEQAKLLAAGDTAGYENRFGRL
ncbi:hypothetical protein U4960_12030 [Altererythrobacter sp. H2]|uniref:hypothetical protein n=1 Tax=Altererythrobacter sp. H2 TaxID=3108391 RepID=UPI002B4BE57C|nr:hypothetical protein [Altererythrobacter sp. H2]WRK95020.1 hypothetical protein U4960_12030 [Altererythrobacter sp. H2]